LPEFADFNGAETTKNFGCPTLAAYLFLRLGWDSAEDWTP